MDMGHKGCAGHAPVAVKIHQDISFCLQHFFLKIFLCQIGHVHILLFQSALHSYHSAALIPFICNRDNFCLYYTWTSVFNQVLPQIFHQSHPLLHISHIVLGLTCRYGAVSCSRHHLAQGFHPYVAGRIHSLNIGMHVFIRPDVSIFHGQSAIL